MASYQAKIPREMTVPDIVDLVTGLANNNN